MVDAWGIGDGTVAGWVGVRVAVGRADVAVRTAVGTAADGVRVAVGLTFVAVAVGAMAAAGDAENPSARKAVKQLNATVTIKTIRFSENVLFIARLHQ